MTLPNGKTISRSYNSVGQLSAITSDWVGATHPATLASNLSYDASGALTSVDYGNGTTSTRSYNSGGQLKTLQHGPSGNPWMLNLQYHYDEGTANNGRIVSIDNLNDTSKTVNYTYDDFYRLASAETVGSHWGLSWSYDRYGNRLSQSVTKGTAPAQSLTVSTTTNRVSGWSYDAAGNTLNDGLHTYTYDANNPVTQLDGGVAVYKYDGQGSRVMKITASETIRYVMGVGEYSSVSGWKKLYLHLGAEKLIEYSGGTTYFYHTDHLGTPKVLTNMAGAAGGIWEYYPFGEEWIKMGGGGQEHRFTGHLRDTESGNEYAGARYYSSTRGRWLSADPLLGSPDDPQSLNRYGYVLNDPVNYVDPTGGEPVLKGPRGPDWEPPPDWEDVEFGNVTGAWSLPISGSGRNLGHDRDDGFTDFPTDVFVPISLRILGTPVDGPCVLSGCWEEPRPDPENPGRRHWGLDILAGHYGDNVYAVSSGMIIETGTTSAGINHLKLDIGFSHMVVTYMHVNPKLTTGEVRSGQLIGTVGADPVSKGPPVHIQMSFFGVFGGAEGNLVDPTPYFPQCHQRSNVRGRR